MPENIVLEENEHFVVNERASKLVSVQEMLTAIENLRKRVVKLETERDNTERAKERRLEKILARAAENRQPLDVAPDETGTGPNLV